MTHTGTSLQMPYDLDFDNLRHLLLFSEDFCSGQQFRTPDNIYTRIIIKETYFIQQT